ncbi:MAG: diguanylate cyclase [Magnetococcales bacterium]|nr:diguanylate cyclase [Magnetococcales bacterium]
MAAQRETLLLVDDESFNLSVLQEFLGSDYDLLLARSGEQALQRVRFVPPPDLILLDIVMPGMDGYQVLARLQADSATREIPVVFITALGEVADEAKGLALGAVDYITKPLSPAIVQARVRTQISLRKSLLALQSMNAQLAIKNEELSRLNAILQNMAMLDGLTGIPNRRHFDNYLEQEWGRAVRDNTALALILLDIDHFKLFNDHYGHAAGDECLKQVARVLADAMSRPVDLLARYGGEEFVCLLPGTDCAGLQVVGNKLCESVRSLGLAHHYSKVADHVTVSLGGTSMMPSRTLAPEVLLKAADARLYQAKAEGRDRLVCSSF